VGTREFGKRVPVRELRDQPTNRSPAASAPAVKPKAPGPNPDQLKKSLLAIALTFVVVGACSDRLSSGDVRPGPALFRVTAIL
jgi:hypothetical protein